MKDLTKLNIKELHALKMRLSTSSADFDTKDKAIKRVEFEIKKRSGTLKNNALVEMSELKEGEL
jgi:hypothetical protein